MAQGKTTFHKNFKTPDETRNFQSHGKVEIINLSEQFGIGRGEFQPGWKWSNDVKPLANTSSCQADHYGYCLSGSMTIRLDNGEQFRIQAGDVFNIPPGHDAWVEGNEKCIMLDISGYENYARKAA